MQLLLAIIGGFFRWLFQFRNNRNKRKTFKEVVWGNKHKIELFSYKIEDVYLGFIICVVILMIVAANY